MDQIRREKTGRRIEDVDLDTREDAEEAAFTAHDAHAIHDALDKLSEKYREVLVL